VKHETKSFYERAVQTAVARVVANLDQALDLERLARAAALSPLHFHRIFRGMLGETPLELHRRLRMERAAKHLLELDTPVTTIAFSAGYDSHEAFTRAFRGFYGRSPSEFRQARGSAGALRAFTTDRDRRALGHSLRRALVGRCVLSIHPRSNPHEGRNQTVARATHRGGSSRRGVQSNLLSLCAPE
jgi:AraC family transcriptional regulator